MDEEIDLLITCYEERKCLWNFSANEYSNRDQKQLAFDSIDRAMSQFDITREDYKANWKVLRGQYMREVASEKKKKSGQSRSEVYVSAWKWYKRLNFLNVVSSTVKAVDRMDMNPSDAFDPDDAENSEPLPKERKTPKKMKEEMKQKGMMVVDKAMGVLNEVQQRPKLRSQEISEEEAFKMVVAKTLARLGEAGKILAKKRINDVLFEVELSHNRLPSQAGSEIQFTSLHGQLVQSSYFGNGSERPSFL